MPATCTRGATAGSSRSGGAVEAVAAAAATCVAPGPAAASASRPSMSRGLWQRPSGCRRRLPLPGWATVPRIQCGGLLLRRRAGMKGLFDLWSGRQIIAGGRRWVIFGGGWFAPFAFSHGRVGASRAGMLGWAPPLVGGPARSHAVREHFSAQENQGGWPRAECMRVPKVTAYMRPGPGG